MHIPDLPKRVPLIVACAFFMQMLDNTIITTSLPQIADSFGVQALDISLGITIYMLTAAAFIPASGWLADRYGSRNVFAAAILVFSLASLACGLADSMAAFVVARAAQGLGGALMTPVGRIVVLRSTPKTGLLRAIAFITWPALIAPVFGPVLGGFITTHASWRWNFFINLPIGLIGLLLVLRFIPNLRESTKRRFDGCGFFLSASALTLLLYGLESVGYADASFTLAAMLCGSGSLLGLMALRHFRRAAEPLLDLSVFAIPTFLLATLSAGFYYRIAISATPFLLPLLFQIGFGLSPWETGLMVLAYFIGNLCMKTVTTPVLRHFGFRHVLVINGLLGALAIASCGLLQPDTPTWVAVALLVAAGMTRSMQFTALTTLTFADTETRQRSSVSTLSSMLQQVSMVLGIAIGALLIKLSQALRGLEHPILADFHNAFAAIGLLGFFAALRFLRLAPDAGAEVRG